MVSLSAGYRREWPSGQFDLPASAQRAVPFLSAQPGLEVSHIPSDKIQLCFHCNIAAGGPLGNCAPAPNSLLDGDERFSAPVVSDLVLPLRLPSCLFSLGWDWLTPPLLLTC
jgi:hypothetical protein